MIYFLKYLICFFKTPEEYMDYVKKDFLINFFQNNKSIKIKR
jgi:hypothetical protein